MIQYEEQLLTLLGYYVVGPDNSNRWIIFDQNHEQIGFIQRKKLYNKNKKKGLPAIFGYCMEIESQSISYKGSRKLDEEYSSLCYQFDLKRNKKLVDHVELNLGSDTPGIFIWSKEYGHMEFRFLWDGTFVVDYKTKTDQFNMREQLMLKLCNQNNETENHSYYYAFSCCDRDKDINKNQDVMISNVTFVSDPLEHKNENMTKIITENWDRGKMINSGHTTTGASLGTIINEWPIGIDVITNFRNFVNQALPFTQDVSVYILEQKASEYPELMLFLPDRKSEFEARSMAKVR